ncbi:MAG: prolyl-tRNA synthetase [Candidatus Zambryskibacteria bacterium RIFCSPHIGHO2_01_FULL_43_27]|uniref:Proline--tRNA ligase n=1 Tax=Candidatus Zambryskibacteria bacterium RIFCSPLOWO2_01_FULL_43_17 TaxID=1802760 RepID=A0A1G2U0S4_9BACT|nr:MAG: prolyl-tRNA synthetase [Candidatus Zambryskibacteria bacterium RIFCSPHIGHO2_01_FULL_43_27]OHB00583.1 MAG: prolyl-tRNA synthetase [Candidatus Zambryskibacteria bacterium RIFCSPHIGHO2_12_FULL_43_12b]OHB03009.1 MAG: prolyl-tRNA synthetase [Candidatus Zambryskibacteria bacterium RIFCSPLOWO2_01_FULL_43_17]
MLQNQLFTKTRKEAPKDEVAKNAQLLIRAGFIHKEMAGAYSFLPLGLMVIEKIKQIVREEMNKIGGQEIIMTSLQRKELWEKTDRWDDEKVDVWFKSALKSGGEVGFGWSHEEPITEMMNSFISSYRDLPVYVYQFQTKMRNELRAKSGIMRGREFVMKDMYSYTTSEEAHKKFYDLTKGAYMRVFERAGLGDRTFLTFASGGAFTKFSHEFQTLTDAGEDVIYLHRGKKIAINKEVLLPEVLEELGVKEAELEEVKAAEVGNIFSFGGSKSEQLGLRFNDEKGEAHPVILGSYGIGITRLMGTVVEIFADDKGIVWPESIAPFKYHLIDLNSKERANKIYKALADKGIEVLFDDRDTRAGEKFADADLIGIPYQVIVSERGEAEKTVEVKNRMTGETKIISEEEFVSS